MRAVLSIMSAANICMEKRKFSGRPDDVAGEIQYPIKEFLAGGSEGATLEVEIDIEYGMEDEDA